jgi:hypothetical protein
MVLLCFEAGADDSGKDDRDDADAMEPRKPLKEEAALGLFGADG